MAKPTKSDLFPAIYSRGLRSKKYLEMQLPKLAHRFFLAKRFTLSLSTLDRLTYPVCFFHKWLGRVGKPLEQLSPQDLENLTDEIKRMPTSREAQAVFRSNIVLYLEWLSTEGLIQVRLHEIFEDSRNKVVFFWKNHRPTPWKSGVAGQGRPPGVRLGPNPTPFPYIVAYL